MILSLRERRIEVLEHSIECWCMASIMLVVSYKKEKRVANAK